MIATSHVIITMKDIKKTGRPLVWTFRIIAFSLILLFSMPFGLVILHKTTLVMSPKGWSRITRGMNKNKVIELIGTPKKECIKYSPDSCYISGYGKPKRAKAAKTMIYLSGEKVFFIFFDKDNNVIETYHAGS